MFFKNIATWIYIRIWINWCGIVTTTQFINRKILSLSRITPRANLIYFPTCPLQNLLILVVLCEPAADAWPIANIKYSSDTFTYDVL